MADFAGNVSLVVQIIALVLLFVGIIPSKLKKQKRNLIIHGYLSILSLALNVATIVAVMLPSYSSFLAEMSQFSVSDSIIIWVHTISGAAAFGLGLVLVVAWAHKPLSKLDCLKRKRLMMPTIIIWVLSVILGVFIHLSGMA
jgi:hypothetical protein